MHKRDQWIPWYFVIFFVAIAAIDATFITLAVTSQTGVVTEKAYEKGLAYDEIINRAAMQSALGVTQKAFFEEGLLTWQLSLEDGPPLDNARITAKLFRPAHQGHDFSLELAHKNQGTYEARPSFPLPGLWTAKLEAEWVNAQGQKTKYNTTLDVIAP